MIQAALGLAAKGKAIFPVAAKGKTPLTAHGCKDATVDPAIVAEWWMRWPAANIGLATGAASHLFVLDIDGEEGEASLAKLEKDNHPLPSTVESITGGGGRHIFFRWPEGGGIGNSASRLGKGLDVRGEGGYVVVPPSIHPSGRKYSWSIDSLLEAVPAPGWLLDLILVPQDRTRAKLPSEWVELMKGMTEGGRNDAVARIAGKLLRCYVEPPLALELCLAWNEARCCPPLTADEVTQVVYSISANELRRRRKT